MNTSMYSFKDDGTLKAPSADELREADNNTFIVTYTSGSAPDGRPYYAFLAVPPSKYREFQEKLTARQPMVLKEYGRILASGFDAQPPDSVLAEMKEQYGYDPNLLEKLREEIGRERQKHGQENEAKRVMDIVAMLKNKTN